MRQIINGLRYDTETATEIGHATSRGYYSTRDFHYWSEGLYVTKKGRYFLAGEGGALSRWSRSIGQNGSTDGEGIRALTQEEALEWCENYLKDGFEDYFTGAITEA